MLQSNYDHELIKHLDLNPFYYEILEAWRLVRLECNRNTPLGDQLIWFNKNIKVRGHSICWENFIQNEIFRVEDLFDINGNIQPFLSLPHKKKQLQFLKWYSLVTIIQKQNPEVNKTFGFDKFKYIVKYKNKNEDLETLNTKIAYAIIRDVLISDSDITKPKTWVQFPEVDREFYKNIYTLTFSIVKDTESQAFQYYFLNDCLVNNYWLNKWKIK